jgi:hypothetical protein
MHIQIYKVCGNYVGLVKLCINGKSSTFIIGARKSSKEVINEALESLN